MGSEAGLDRRAAMRLLIAERDSLRHARESAFLLVTGLGATSWDAAAIGDDPRNFYLWGAMGGAAMLGLGLALAQPERPVLVVTGDGEMLMGLSALATIGALRPRNLAIAVFDNARYGETGMQASHTQESTSLAAVARACGIEKAFDIADETALRDFSRRLPHCDGTLFARIKILADVPPRVLPPRDPVLLRTRFRRALGIAA